MFFHLPWSHQAPPPQQQTWRLQRFWALVAKYTLQDGIESNDDCFVDNEENEFDIGNSDKNSDSGNSEDKVYTWPT